MKTKIINRIQRKQLADLISKIVIFAFALTGIAVLVLLFSMILKEAVPAYKHYGFWHMYFTADFTEKGGWGIWGALAVTLVTAIAAVIIALPIAVRASIFIHYRMKWGKKGVRTLINILSGVPSVVFGIFALSSLTGFTKIFGVTDPSTIFVGIVVLIIMVFPTLVSMISNQLDLVSEDLINSSLALGRTSTYSLYRIVKKSIRQGIYVSAIMALGRTMGETMALSMILQVAPLNNPFANGLGDFLNSSGASLGVMVSRNMFSDSSDPNHRAALFAAGMALFVVAMLLILIMAKFSKPRSNKNENPFNLKELVKAEDYPAKSIYYFVLGIHIILVPFKIIRYALVYLMGMISIGIEYFKQIISYPINKLIYPPRNERVKSNRDYFIATSRFCANRITDYFRRVLEVVSLFIIIGSIVWIVIVVFSKGIPAWSKKDWTWSYYEYTYLGKIEKPGVILNTMVFTIVLVLISILIALPLSFATAIYLSEYAGNRKTGKVVKFFLDSLGGTPSIIFGMFGIVFFRQVLGLGNGGFSLIAGALTMTIVIIPTFTRSIEQVLVNIPMELRMAAYSLGASKIETIWKVIIPQALPGIITGIILSAGRVIAETAPVYLTIGMLGNISLNVNGSGWTMTTKILYNQIFSTDDAAAMLRESYAIASATFILITALILITESIQPLIRYKPVTRFIIRPIVKQIKLMKTNFKHKGVRNAK